MKEKLSMLELEKLHAGEKSTLDPASAMVQNELEELQKSDEAIRARYAAEDMKAAVMRKLAQNAAAAGTEQAVLSMESDRADKADGSLQSDGTAARGKSTVHTFFTTGSLRYLAYAAVFAVAVMLPLTVGRTGSLLPDDAALLPGTETVRAKGNGPRLNVYKKSGDVAVKITSNEHVNAGDVLQLSYIAAGEKYGMIFSVDGNGTVTKHLPETGTEAVQLDNQGEVALGYSYQLDDAPEYERFVFVTAKKPFTSSLFKASEIDEAAGGAGETADFSSYFSEKTIITDVILLK